jgi:hypothetical protein
MSEHQKEIDEFGNNDDFWLFGYGYSDHQHIALVCHD